MTLRRAILGFVAISAVYLLGLVWADGCANTFRLVGQVAQVLPVLVGLAFVSWCVRYLRWHWLLQRAGYRPGWAYGYLAYLSGFAFTATPGKVGELVRIRYLGWRAVPGHVVFGAFVYERWFDLIVVFLLGMAAFGQQSVLWLSGIFVALFTGVVVVLASFPHALRLVEAFFVKRKMLRLGSMVNVVKDGLISCRAWMNAPDVTISFTLGVLAWSITAFSFCYLLAWLGLPVPLLSAFGSYPLAMLAGAASMLPGGIGSTEISLVAILGVYDIPLEVAMVTAIAIRVAGMWFSILFGFAAMLILELCERKDFRRGA